MNFLTTLGAIAEAGTVSLKPGFGLAGQVDDLKLSQIVGGLLTLILVIAALIFFFMLVVGGIRWIASGGDKGATEGARNQITAALVGLVIVFSAWAISNLIEAFFGVDIFELQIPNVNDITGGTI